MKQKIILIRVLVVIIASFHLGPLLSQNEVFHTFIESDGLPENTANALLQDSKGKIWVGTQAGVAIYDGARFKSIGTESEEGISLSNNMVESLYEDSNGIIYIGTRNGMNIYNPRIQSIKIITLDTSNIYGNNFCRPGFYEDAEVVWFITRHSIFKIHKNSFQIEAVHNFAPQNLGVMKVFNKKFLISIDSNLLVFDPQKNETKKLIALPHYITSLSDIDGKLWIGTLEGVYDMSGKLLFKELKSDAVLFANKSMDGRIWMGTTTGIAVYDGKSTRFIRSNENNQLRGSLFLSFLEDQNGVLWFGSNSALNRLIPTSEKIEKNTDHHLFNLPSNHIASIACSFPFHMVAIGTDKGVNLSKIKYNGRNVLITRQENFLKGQPVNFINTDIMGNIWVGTKAGEVYRFDKNFSQVKLKGKIKGIRGFYFDTVSRQIFIAGSEGLFAAGVNGKIYRPKWTDEIKYSVSILNKNNGFLVSHSDLIYDVDLINRKVTRIVEKQKITSYMLTHQLVTDSCSWFSSISGGVFSYFPDGNSWGNYNVLNGKNIWSTFSDSLGRFWSNSDDGLYIHNGKKVIRKLDVDDGLNYNDFKMSAQCQLNNNLLIYGNEKGLIIINPTEIESSGWRAKPYISDIKINFKSRPIANLSDMLLLKPDEKSISLYIGLTDFLSSSKAELSYKLENLNASWSQYTPIAFPVSFTGLPSGEYLLQIKVKDKSGRVSDQILSQKIKILPHFYETIWFKLIIFLLLTIILVFIINFRYRQKRKAIENKLITEKEISNERERISRDLHDSIGARLTKIISDLDIMELQTEVKQKPVSIEDLSKTRDYTRDTINNLRETIWTLDSKIIRLQDVYHQSKKYIERYLPESIEFDIQIQKEFISKEIHPEVAVNIFRIIQELTQNMLKYSKANKFSVHFVFDGKIKLIVEDNGVGFDYKTVSKGEGLKNIQKRLDKISGKLTYENNSGSKFIIHFN